MTYKLSEREGDVFLLLLNGKSNKDISKNLFIEEGTVKNHLTNIYKKLSIKNRTELMRLPFKSSFLTAKSLKTATIARYELRTSFFPKYNALELAHFQ